MTYHSTVLVALHNTRQILRESDLDGPNFLSSSLRVHFFKALLMTSKSQEMKRFPDTLQKPSIQYVENSEHLKRMAPNRLYDRFADPGQEFRVISRQKSGHLLWFVKVAIISRHRLDLCDQLGSVITSDLL